MLISFVILRSLCCLLSSRLLDRIDGVRNLERRRLYLPLYDQSMEILITIETQTVIHLQ
jgi:hypothetical protein